MECGFQGERLKVIFVVNGCSGDSTIEDFSDAVRTLHRIRKDHVLRGATGCHDCGGLFDRRYVKTQAPAPQILQDCRVVVSLYGVEQLDLREMACKQLQDTVNSL